LKQPHALPFHIAIGPRGSDGVYAVRATTKGGETTTELELPEALLALANRLLQPGIRLPLGDAPALGQALGRALLAPPLRDMLLRSARAAAQSGDRLQVQLQIATPELAALPWEWMALGAARPWSPALRDDYALVRVGRSMPAPSPVAVAGALRILAIGSLGEELQLESLHAALAPAVHNGQVELRLLRDATPHTLEIALGSDTPHVLHCAAPIGFAANGAPHLLLGRGLAAFDLAALAAEARELRLVTLAGQQGDAAAVSAAPALMAALLVGEELPAVIAFGGPLPAPLTARFAAACYARLTEGAPVDLAVTAGRSALAEHANSRGWGFPQLRLLPGGEQLFASGRARSVKRARRQLAALPRRPAARGARRQPVRGARAGRPPFPRWMLIPIAAALLLALLLAGRWMSGRSDLSSGSSQTLQPTTAQGTAVPLTTAVVRPLAATATSTQTSALSPAEAAAAAAQTTIARLGLPDIAPAGYATFMTADGDSLDSIAEKMGSHPAAIAELNHLDPFAPLRPDRPLVIPVFRPGVAGAGGLIINHGNAGKPQVALTFDIEIDDATLYAILDILRERGLRGTFFITGGWVQAFPDAARAIVREGHEIGNHSYTHPYFSRIGLNGAEAELEATERIIRETTGTTSRPYFRFPYGDSTPDTTALVAQQGYVAYHWSADDVAISGWLDWAAQHRAAAGGGILLMHGRASTVESLPGWLDRLAELGLQPTTLGEVLK
jgi:peptidoglycan/xylan/chitin deacetylase (PgdA/CDA1 family)